MTVFRNLLGGAAAIALAACGGASTETPEGDDNANELHEKLVDVAKATYALEKSHAFLSFKIGHGHGTSSYQISFTDFDATLVFDPADPEASKLDVTVNPMAVEANYRGYYSASHPDSIYATWNEDISRNPVLLDGDTHPEITFTSTGIQRTGDDTGTVTGDLTLLGVTNPVTFDVSFGGVANVPWFGERDVLGFDATSVFNRADWGLTAYAPMIGEDITVSFSGEFLQNEE